MGNTQHTTSRGIFRVTDAGRAYLREHVPQDELLRVAKRLGAHVAVIRRDGKLLWGIELPSRRYFTGLTPGHVLDELERGYWESKTITDAIYATIETVPCSNPICPEQAAKGTLQRLERMRAAKLASQGRR